MDRAVGSLWRVALTRLLARQRITLQGCNIGCFDAQSGRHTIVAPVSPHHSGQLDTALQPFHPGFPTAGLLSSARRAFTVPAHRRHSTGSVQVLRSDGGGTMISTEDRPSCNFLRTKPLLWVAKGAPFCLQGTYNGAQFHGQRGKVAVGPAADGAPIRA